MERDDEFDLDELSWRRPSFLPVVLPFAAAASALAVGIGLGALSAWMVLPREVVEVDVPRQLTELELEAACAPSVAEKADELVDATERIDVLSAEINSKQTKVDELKAEMTRRSERGRQLVAELKAAKEELAQAKLDLQIALEEKAELVVELAQTTEQLEETEEKLDEQIAMTDRAKEDALTNKWYRFLNDAQLDICEKGGRKKTGKCRESVLLALAKPDVRDKFAHCVRSNQAVPSVGELDKHTTMPQYSAYLNQDDRQVKDWYVHLCDPTLPEADGFLNEEHLPRTARAIL